MTGIETSINTLPCFFWRMCGYNEDRRNFLTKDISFSDYRYIVLKDLEDLLNTKVALAGHSDWVKKSVLNYGICCCIGTISSQKTDDNIISNIKQAIINFEPRFVADSIKVDIIEYDKPECIKNIAIEITAQLKMFKSLEYLKFKTKIEVDTGHFKIEGKSVE